MRTYMRNICNCKIISKLCKNCVDGCLEIEYYETVVY